MGPGQGLQIPRWRAGTLRDVTDFVGRGGDMSAVTIE